MENLKRIITETRNGKKIWDFLKREYRICDKDLFIFFELCDHQFDSDIKEILTDISLGKKEKVFMVTSLDTCFYEKCGITIIKLSPEKYMSLRCFYVVTVFHRNVRVITDKEPFGNNKLMMSGNIKTSDWVRRKFFKEK